MPVVDASNGYVYVSNFRSNIVSVIDSIDVDQGANICSDSLSVIGTENNSVIVAISVNSYQGGIAHDSANNCIQRIQTW